MVKSTKREAINRILHIYYYRYGKKITSIAIVLLMISIITTSSINTTSAGDTHIILEETASAETIDLDLYTIDGAPVFGPQVMAIKLATEPIQNLSSSEESGIKSVSSSDTYESNEDSIIEEISEEIEEEKIVEEVEEPEYISEYWKVTKEQLKAYFGYVPDVWELAYFEACVMAECGYEPEEGIKAVCDCIGYIRTNIDDRFPDTIYGVITQKNQFSTWSNGSVDKWLGNVSETVHNICVNQIINGSSYDYAFFTAGQYNSYCTPGGVIGHHYFGY